VRRNGLDPLRAERARRSCLLCQRLEILLLGRRQAPLGKQPAALARKRIPANLERQPDTLKVAPRVEQLGGESLSSQLQSTADTAILASWTASREDERRSCLLPK
jgi:hypothetical protein